VSSTDYEDYVTIIIEKELFANDQSILSLVIQQGDYLPVWKSGWFLRPVAGWLPNLWFEWKLHVCVL